MSIVMLGSGRNSILFFISSTTFLIMPLLFMKKSLSFVYNTMFAASKFASLILSLGKFFSISLIISFSAIVRNFLKSCCSMIFVYKNPGELVSPLILVLSYALTYLREFSFFSSIYFNEKSLLRGKFFLL